jgi:radical SAM superfamily enzyme YgiQ (UPF0313 family)
MNGQPVVFVAFKEYDNLGVGYLASILAEEGYEPLIIDFRNDREEILEVIKKLNPLIVGFSVIFQYYINEFKDLINYLRKSGIASHFSAGGQFASMRVEDLFKLIPSLDSIVRFEGEYTFLELVNQIHSGKNWRNLKGLAFKENAKIITNQVRQPEMDLDIFPYPMRSTPEDYALGKKYATIIAGRGCLNNCSFCNNTEYIRQSLVPFKRLRKPEKVVEEIEYLHHKKDCSVFLFEDDDFPVKTGNGSDWIEKFCRELKRKGLSDKVIWKINCRPDEVGYDSFDMMKNHGLYLVFLGIDDGTDEGLAKLNKRMTISISLKGINTLKKLGIGLDYGFMLFQPSSTFGSINLNLSFLRQITSDGSTPVTFLKLMPYFDTKIEKELRKDGRLKGEPGFLDYDFLEGALNHYYNFIKESFLEWINDPNGLSNIIKWGRNYFSVFSHFYSMTPDVQLISSEFRTSVAQSNMFIINTMEELSGIFETGKYENFKINELSFYRENIKVRHDQYKEKIGKLIKNVSRIAEYQRLSQLIKF